MRGFNITDGSIQKAISIAQSVAATNNNKQQLFNNDIGKDITDTYVYRVEDEKHCIVRASDENEYNLKEIILTKLDNLISNTINDNNPTAQKIAETIHQTFEKIENLNDIKQLFESQTGEQYNTQNIENFLKGKIKLLAEKDYQMKLGRLVKYVPAPPYIKSDYCTDAVKNKLNKQRKVLTQKENISYAKIYNSLSKDMKVKFEKCLNSGKLLQTDSKNGRTVLDILYKIFSAPRAAEVNKQALINECINILDNPLVITQIAEDIPEKFLESATNYVYNIEENICKQKQKTTEPSENMRLKTEESGENKLNKEDELKRIREKLENRGVGTCVAASIEYTLATKYPVKFFRIVEGITSEKKETKFLVNCKKADLTDDVIDIFCTPYKVKNGMIEVALKADEGAYRLAKIQKNYQDNNERTTVDILVQSLIFQIGTKGTYDSIRDEHAILFGEKDGLCFYEEDYILRILTGKATNNKDYMKYDDNNDIVGRTNKILIEKDINTALCNGNYLMIGINCSGDDKNIDGHELTIMGSSKGLDGTEYYICKDTDSEYARPLLIDKDTILDRIMTINIIN